MDSIIRCLFGQKTASKIVRYADTKNQRKEGGLRVGNSCAIMLCVPGDRAQIKRKNKKKIKGKSKEINQIPMF